MLCAKARIDPEVEHFRDAFTRKLNYCTEDVTEFECESDGTQSSE